MSTVVSSGIAFLNRPGGGKKAVIAGSRIRVSQIAIEHERLGMTPEDIHAAHPHIKLYQIFDSLAYYFRHKDEIDGEIEDDEKMVKRFAKKYKIAYPA